MQSKTCTKCLVEKPLDCFHYKCKARGTRKPRCKICSAEFHKAHYQANKGAYKASRTALKSKLIEWFRIYKETHPCTDCGVQYQYYTMQFDHVADDKEFDVSQMLSLTTSRQRIEAEIAKCEIVCANYHTIRTHKRLHPTR